MREKHVRFSRRKMLRRAGLAALVVTAALVLSGCWGTYTVIDASRGEYIVTVKEQQSAETIYICESRNPGNSRGRAECALDVVRWACGAEPLAGWNIPACRAATDYQSDTGCNRVPGGLENCAEAMKRAIGAVLGDRECIAYEHKVGGPSYGWFGVDRGFPGCP